MLISAALIALARPGWAKEQDSVSNELVDFDIAEQPLGAALERFMTLSNVTIVVDSGVIGGRQSTAVRGAFTLAGALQLLLEGTGLGSQPIGPGAYTLVALPPGAERRLPRFADYAVAVQRAVVAALCRLDEAARPMRYRTVVRLWLQPGGKARRAELAISTGNAARDTAIAESLQHVDIGMAVPTSLPQPIKLAIAPRTSDDAMCVPDHRLDRPTTGQGR